MSERVERNSARDFVGQIDRMNTYKLTMKHSNKEENWLRDKENLRKYMSY